MQATIEQTTSILASNGFSGAPEHLTKASHQDIALSLTQTCEDMVAVTLVAENKHVTIGAYTDAISEVVTALEATYFRVHAYWAFSGDTYLVCSNGRSNRQMDEYARSRA